MNGLYEDNDGIYSMLAPFYDSFNGEIDYKKWAKFIDRIVRNNFFPVMRNTYSTLDAEREI